MQLKYKIKIIIMKIKLYNAHKIKAKSYTIHVEKLFIILIWLKIIIIIISRYDRNLLCVVMSIMKKKHNTLSLYYVKQ